MPSLSSEAPSFFFSMPALKAGSKSSARVTLDPGVTRNGSMKRAIRLVMSSAMSLVLSFVAGRWRPDCVAVLRDVAPTAVEFAQPMERLLFELAASLLAHAERGAD